MEGERTPNRDFGVWCVSTPGVGDDQKVECVGSVRAMNELELNRERNGNLRSQTITISVHHKIDDRMFREKGREGTASS